MRFSNRTWLRFATLRYSQTWMRLTCIAGGLSILSRFIGYPAKTWVKEVGLLAVVAEQAVLLVGLIADRKGW